VTISARRLSTIFLVLLIAVSPLALAKAKSPWTQFRGPSAEGPSAADDLPTSKFGLAVAWSRDLGSGYSNVWIAKDKAVTMFTAGEIDVVAAFDLASGDEVWRYELGQKYSGHDGSDDGPIGTPTVSDGTVYALGPNGVFVALALADGKETWRHELNEGNSSVPFYGYTTSPLVVGDQVILATGGEGHAVTAFDRKSGEPKWTRGDDTVSYQTPMLVELGGRSQLLTLTNHLLMGLDPTTGEVLWQLQHSEGDQLDEAAHPTVIDDERFLVKYARGARLYRMAADGAEEVWQTRAFGNTYALPVLVGGHLYGYSGTVLTCVDVATGEIVWRSRELRSQGLSAIGGTLAVLSADGNLVLIDPSPESYREITRTSVFEEGDYAVPTFSDGTFLVRNLEKMAAVRIDRSLTPQVAEVDDTDRLRGEFGAWVASVEALSAGERASAVESRFADVETTPLFEEDGIVHVVWRGDAEDVGLTGDVTGGGAEIGLYQIEGTDLFFRSLQLDPKAQYSYGLIVDFGNPQADPGNPYTIDNGFLVFSELRMPEWPASPHLDPPAEDAPRGTLDGFPFRSEILENRREIRVWRPATYGRDPEQRYPVLVVNHGDNLLRGGLMQNTLDNLVGTSVAPLIAVFVPRVAGPEYGGPLAENYNRFLIEELLPHLDRHYLTDPTRRAIMGPGSAGVAAVFAALAHPDVFPVAATQSFYPVEPTHEQLASLIAGAGTKPELIYVVWSRHDYDLGQGRRADDASRELIGLLRDADIAVVEQISDYSPGWAGWRGQDDEILVRLFPMPATE
jgi:outer membrane protein assembly factor BamB/enterochelin esterase-like enzyme